MRKVSNLFDIGKSTVSKVIRRVTQAISQFFGNSYFVLPTNQKELENMLSNFYSAHSFQQCIGVVHGTHVGVKKSSRNASYCHQQKRASSYSLTGITFSYKI